MLDFLFSYNRLISTPERLAQQRWGLPARHITSLICYAAFPLTLVSLPWKTSAYVGLVVSVLIILGVVGGYVIYIFGYSGMRYRRGLVDYVAERGRGDALLEVIDAMVTTTANFGVIFAALERMEPGTHFSVDHPTVPVLDFLYYSVVTFTTLGYGDIVPISWQAKLLSLGELALAFLILFVGLGLVIAARETAGGDS